MGMGNPVITTNFSGNTDFMTKTNSYLIDYQLTPVTHMPWIEHYEATMEWAEPNLSQLKEVMKEVYSHRKKAIQVGLKGKKFVLDKFNQEESAKSFTKACEELKK
jgi:hypothetical protein